MKKIVIGLLVVAAGAGAFFILRKKKNSNAITHINKEWIIGQWIPVTNGTDTTMTHDSVFSTSRFDFKQDGTVIQSLKDSVKADTSRYEWKKANELVWKQKKADSTGNVYIVTQLSKDSLTFLASDSTTILFIKAN